MPWFVACHKIHTGLRPETQRDTKRGVMSHFQSWRHWVPGGITRIPVLGQNARPGPAPPWRGQRRARRAEAPPPGPTPAGHPLLCKSVPWPCSNGLAAFEHFPLDPWAPREVLAHQDHETQNLCSSKLHFFSCFKHLTFPNCLLQSFSLDQTSCSLADLSPAMAGPLPGAQSPTAVAAEGWWSHARHSPRSGERTKTW